MTTQNAETAHNLGNYRVSHSSPAYGERYQDTYRHGYYFYQWEYLERDLVEAILHDLHVGGSRSCLDFACGTGRITRIASEVFNDITAVDVSASMLDVARGELPHVQFIQHDMTQASLDAKFDVVTAFRFFTNAEDELKSEALAAIYEALDERGVLVANIHQNRDSVVGWIYRLRNWWTGKLTARVVGHREFESLLEQHGFEIVQTHWYSYLPRTGWRFPWLAKYLMRPVEWLCQGNLLVPRSIAACFVVVCRKRGCTAARSKAA